MLSLNHKILPDFEDNPGDTPSPDDPPISPPENPPDPD